MNFDETQSNSVRKSKPKVTFAGKIDNPSDFITKDIMGSFKEALESFVEKSSEDHQGTSIDPAVIVHSIKNMAKENLGEYGMLGVEFESKVYTLDDMETVMDEETLADGGAGSLCEAAGTLASNDELYPVAVFTVSEAWLAKYSKEDLENGAPKMSPSESPDKLEVLIVGGMSVNKLSCLTIYEIIRDEKERITLKKRDDLSREIEEEEVPVLSRFFISYAKN